MPVTPTALHERVGLSEDDGICPSFEILTFDIRDFGSDHSLSEQSWTSILLALYGAALLAASREFDHPWPPDYIVTILLTVLLQISYFRLLSRSDRV